MPYGRLQGAVRRVVILFCAAFGCEATTDGRVDVQRQSIVGGSPAQASEFSSVVWLDAGCTGVLVAPDTVIFAAHCGEPHSLYLGDSVDLDLAEGGVSVRGGLGQIAVASCKCRAVYPAGAAKAEIRTKWGDAEANEHAGGA
jgi:hypothetical protein